MTIKVGVSSSAGYVRKMKRTSGSMNYYYTFYSTFGINSKIGAKDTSVRAFPVLKNKTTKTNTTILIIIVIFFILLSFLSNKK